MVESARKLGISIIHAKNNPNVKELINHGDFVIGYGRGLYEGMACERPALIYGIHGCDGWINEWNFPQYLYSNCSGYHTECQYDEEGLIDLLSKYNLFPLIINFLTYNWLYVLIGIISLTILTLILRKLRKEKKSGIRYFYFGLIVIIVGTLIIFFIPIPCEKFELYTDIVKYEAPTTYQETVNYDNCDSSSSCVCTNRGGFLWLTCKQCSCTRQTTEIREKIMKIIKSFIEYRG